MYTIWNIFENKTRSYVITVQMNANLIENLYIIFISILCWLIWKNRLTLKVWKCANSKTTYIVYTFVHIPHIPKKNILPFRGWGPLQNPPPTNKKSNSNFKWKPVENGTFMSILFGNCEMNAMENIKITCIAFSSQSTMGFRLPKKEAKKMLTHSMNLLFF